jgi:hypothetical protein
MFRLYENLIGYERVQRLHKLNFSGSDNVERFENNLKTQPDDWYYRNVKITYNRNLHGHRCKNISEIDFDNYILFAGCSHTEGIGLELEKTYPYLVSKELNCDYYNLGIGGCGVDVVIHNLIVWLNTYKKPKAIIVQWPVAERFLHSLENPHKVSISDPHSSLLEVGSWTANEVENEFLVIGDYIHYFKTVEALAKIKIKSFDIPQIHINILLQPGFFRKDYINLIGDDLARDLMHYGIKSHQEFANDVRKKLMSDYQI